MLPARSNNPRQPRSTRKCKETPQDTLRKLQRLPDNKRCADCRGKLPGSVCLTFQTFVCSSCAGIHREFSHRIKGVGHSSFTQEEVQVIVKAGGNGVVNGKYLAKYDSVRERLRAPDGEAGAVDQQLCRVWIRRKYIDKQWFQDDDAADDIVSNSAADLCAGKKVGKNEATIVSIPEKTDTTTTKHSSNIDLFGGGEDGAWETFGTSSAVTSAPADSSSNTPAPVFDVNFDNVPALAPAATAFEADFDSMEVNQIKVVNELFKADFNDNFFNQAAHSLSQQQQNFESPMFEASFGQPMSGQSIAPADTVAKNPTFDVNFDPQPPTKKGNPFASFQQQPANQTPAPTGNINFESNFRQMPQEVGNPFAQQVTMANAPAPMICSQQPQQAATTQPQQTIYQGSNISSVFDNQQNPTQQLTNNSMNNMTHLQHNGLQQVSQMVSANMSQNQYLQTPPQPPTSVVNSQQVLHPPTMMQVQNPRQDMCGSIQPSMPTSQQQGPQRPNPHVLVYSQANHNKSSGYGDADGNTRHSVQDGLTVNDAFAGLDLDTGASPLASPVINNKDKVLDEDDIIAKNVDNINSPVAAKKKMGNENPSQPPTFPQLHIDSASVISAITMNEHVSGQESSNLPQPYQPTTASASLATDQSACLNKTNSAPIALVPVNQSRIQQQDQHKQTQAPLMPMLSNHQMHMLQLMQNMSPHQLQQMQLMMQMQPPQQQQHLPQQNQAFISQSTEEMNMSMQMQYPVQNQDISSQANFSMNNVSNGVAVQTQQQSQPTFNTNGQQQYMVNNMMMHQQNSAPQMIGINMNIPSQQVPQYQPNGMVPFNQNQMFMLQNPDLAQAQQSMMMNGIHQQGMCNNTAARQLENQNHTKISQPKNSANEEGK